MIESGFLVPLMILGGVLFFLTLKVGVWILLGAGLLKVLEEPGE